MKSKMMTATCRTQHLSRLLPFLMPMGASLLVIASVVVVYNGAFILILIKVYVGRLWICIKDGDVRSICCIDKQSVLLTVCTMSELGLLNFSQLQLFRVGEWVIVALY